jgi:acyl-CoA synthetase (AMP-forming)/AMP-acid ligase II
VIQLLQTAFPLPAGHPLLADRFDAILSLAVIMHLPDADLFEFACQVRQMLTPGGTLILSISEGRTLDPAELIGFLRERMAHFMVPRYVRVMDDLPKTPTQKVQKHLIRSAGVTADTWDREAAGVVVRRDRLSG